MELLGGLGHHLLVVPPGRRWIGRVRCLAPSEVAAGRPESGEDDKAWPGRWMDLKRMSHQDLGSYGPLIHKRCQNHVSTVPCTDYIIQAPRVMSFLGQEKFLEHSVLYVSLLCFPLGFNDLFNDSVFPQKYICPLLCF